MAKGIVVNQMKQILIRPDHPPVLEGFITFGSTVSLTLTSSPLVDLLLMMEYKGRD